MQENILNKQDLQKQEYGIFDIKNNNLTISNYINNVEQMSKATAFEYRKRLRSFATFVREKYAYNSVDVLIDKLTTKEKKKNTPLITPYDVLSSYVSYLNRRGTVSSYTLKQRMVTVKNFFEFHDIEISPRRLKLKVKLPKIIRKNREALTKEDIIEILNACSDIRLKTYVMLVASTGLRATEGLSTRLCDYDFESDPPKLFVRGEYTKTRTDRIVFLTQETVKQLKNWLEFKYRTRRVCYYDKNTGKSKWDYRSPIKNNKDLMFSVNPSTKGYSIVSPPSLYAEVREVFSKTLDRIGRGEREDLHGINVRRKITLHSFRRYVKSTISDLGYGDYSEWFIGHIGSTYYRKTDKEMAEIFRRVEPYLTFLDLTTLERKGADTQTRIEELQATNQMLRQRDSMNTEAIANLSDQLMKIMQEIEILKSNKG